MVRTSAPKLPGSFPGNASTSQDSPDLDAVSAETRDRRDFPTPSAPSKTNKRPGRRIRLNTALPEEVLNYLRQNCAPFPRSIPSEELRQRSTSELHSS